MSQRILIGLGVVVAATIFLLVNALFTVHQTQQALILQFGNPVRVIDQPGLSVKVPFIQQVEFFERRVLDYDAGSVELVLGDQRRLVVDAFARYRITDPLRFRQSVGNEVAFRGRLEPITFSALRSVLGEVSLFTILSEERNRLMRRIADEANTALRQFGVEVIDVRIKRADLPTENQEAIFLRMQTEREREARELRAQGEEIAQRIRARADRERRVLIAEAGQEAEQIRGRGDAIAIATFAEAFGQDPAFFGFYRSMQAYRNSLADEATSFVLAPDSDFFRFFHSAGDIALQVAGAPAAAPDVAEVLEELSEVDGVAGLSQADDLPVRAE
jgi:modulator of FtsH protease HflC